MLYIRKEAKAARPSGWTQCTNHLTLMVYDNDVDFSDSLIVGRATL